MLLMPTLFNDMLFCGCCSVGTKRVQDIPSNIDNLEGLLHDMHVDCDVDVMSDPIWDRLTAVPIQRIRYEEHEQDEYNVEGGSDILN